MPTSAAQHMVVASTDDNTAQQADQHEKAVAKPALRSA
jgi:hypothetical protein